MVCSRLYRDSNRDERRSFMISGTGRSGTTWLAEIVGSQIPCRLMFEPFNPRMQKSFSQFEYFQYMRPGDSNAALAEYCRNVFSGNIRSRWIDQGVTVLRPQYRMIKAIRANLMLKWIHQEFPAIPIIFIIRHPCAVVSSRIQLDWATDSDTDSFRVQPGLIEDFLADKLEYLQRARTPEEKHALIWCVSNLVPLRQFRAGELTTVFYEDLCRHPEPVIERVFRRLGHEYHASVMSALRRPSGTAVRSSAIVSGGDYLTTWQRELSPRQIHNVLSVVDAFGLGHLYGESAVPCPQPGGNP